MPLLAIQLNIVLRVYRANELKLFDHNELYWINVSHQIVLTDFEI